MLKKVLAYFFSLLFLFTSFFCLVKPYFHSSFPYTHDGENHMARFANYTVALKEGQFPPRLAPNLMNHYGYPVFNYNYPLANILSVPFSLLKINYELTFKILMITSVAALLAALIFGAAQKYDLKSKQETLSWKNITPWQISFSALLLQIPYLYNLIYYRGNIGEMMAIVFALWSLQLIRREAYHKKNNGRTLSRWFWLTQCLVLVCLFLSHNILAFFLTPIIFIYGWVKLGTKTTFSLSNLLKWLIAGGLSLWFWLPALFEKSFTILDEAGLSQSFTQHFATLKQLILSPLEFGFSQVGSVDTLSFSLGFTAIILIIFSLIFVAKYFFNSKVISKENSLRHYLNSDLTFWTIIFILSIFLQLSSSEFIYQIIPFFNFIQFPWRFGALTFLALIFFMQNIWQFWPNWSRWLCLIVGVFYLTQLFQLQPADYFHRELVDYQAFSQSTSTANENLPQTWNYADFAAGWQPNVTIIPDGAGESTISKFNTTQKKYQLNLAQPALIIEPTMFFPGFETKVYSESETSFPQNALNTELIVYTENATTAGRIAYELPAGLYQITTTFTQNTPARLVGNSLSLISAAILLIIFFFFPKLIINQTLPTSHKHD